MVIIMDTKKFDKTLLVFFENAEKYGNAILEGNYKEANRAYNKIIKSKNTLVSEDRLDSIYHFINMGSPSVKLWIARYLLFNTEYYQESRNILEHIKNSEENLLSTIAEQTLIAWDKGNLTLDY